MTRALYDRDLRRLENEVQTLGNMVGDALRTSVANLRHDDLDASQRLMAFDREINSRRYRIEAEIMTLIATQAPVAGDIRLLAAMLEIVTELERMGDYAKGIATIHVRLAGWHVPLDVLDRLERMADIGAAMLGRALDSFEHRDDRIAHAVIADDDRIDDLFNEVFAATISGPAGDARAIERANYVLWLAHNLERAADRVTNICERVIYTVTGQLSIA
ncbi:MAG: phosphate signaling complex protein PhoU [Ardenticatenales bacterium]